ncbi:MAG: heme NO-binding domain-containing protein [Acidimicrobiia bacterium]|nr:heme NO-binding domain-containing protein [Acidimicrobiia bacterium]
MKGVIFNVVEEVVTDLWSDDLWDQVIEGAGVTGAYTALGDYPDADLHALVASASALSGIEPPDLLRAIGRRALPQLIDRLPDAAAGAGDAETLLRRVNDIIHPEVLKLYPDAIPPVFEFVESPAGLQVTYRSARRLGQLAVGLIEGCGDRFDQTTTVEAVGGDPERHETVWLVTYDRPGAGAR